MNRTFRTLAIVMALAVAGLLGVATRSHAQAFTTGSITGTITDAAGTPLSGVQITIEDTGQSDITNANGYYLITEVLPGVHTLVASLVGFETVQATNVNVTQELTTTVNLKLEKRTVRETGTTRVVVPLVRKNVTPTLYTVTSQEEQLVRSQPNNLYQYPGALISQPGIVPDQDGYPTVRGARQNEVGYMLDGILIQSATDGQFATNLVTVGMDRMNVYTGGYRADLGSTIGGIINAVVKTGASMRGAAVEASVGSWDYTGLVYEQGNVEKNGFNWYVGGNFWRTRYEKNHQIAELPVSEDITAKFIQPLGDKDRITAFFAQGQERYVFPVNDPFTGRPWGADPNYDYPGTQAIHTREWDTKINDFVPTNETTDYSFQQHRIGSLTWTHQFTPSSTLTAQGYTWNQGVNFNLLSPANLTDQKTGSVKTSGKLDFTTQVSPSFQVRIGGEYADSMNDQRIVFDVTDLLQFTDEEGNLIPVIQHRKAGADTKDLNAYLSTTWRPSDRLTLDLGVRYDSREYEREISDEGIALGRASSQAADLAILAKTGRNPKYDEITPRAGLTYALSPRTIFKASAGRFVQFAPGSYLEREYFNTPYDRPIPLYSPGGTNYYAYRSRKVFDVAPEKVDSYDVGIEAQVTNNIGIGITPFYRKTNDMFDYGQAYNEDGTPMAGGLAWVNDAHGTTRGVETKIQMRERKGLSGWISYTYQDAKATTTDSFPGSGAADLAPDAKERRLNYDQKHTIYLVGQYRTGNLEINPMLELGSGYPWGSAGDYYEFDEDDNVVYRTGYTFNPRTGDPMPILIDGKLQSGESNIYNTGWHDNLNVTFRYFMNKERTDYYFLQIQNIYSSKDATAKAWQDPNGSSLMDPHYNDPVTYIDENGQEATANDWAGYTDYTRVSPIFVLLGVRKSF